jgi:hypothetical protein
VADRVFLHIGLPKTGTTYLQSVLWGARKQLAKDGWLLPGSGHREHLWAALDLQERPHLERRHPDAPGALARLVEEVRRHRGPAVITHEFFCGAGREQAGALIESLAPAEVHVVVTARDTLGMLTAGWAEYVKNGGTEPLSAMSGEEFENQPEFGWRTWDLAGVLRRWGRHVAPEHVHVVPMPAPGSPSDQHWRSFAGVLGLDPERYDVPQAPANPALGATQVELLRRINPLLVARGSGEFRSALARGSWIRGYLAERHLVAQGGERLGAGPEQVAECRRRAERAVGIIERKGYQVVGGAAGVRRLLVPDELPTRPQPDEVGDRELLDAATTLVAAMLADVRHLSQDDPDMSEGA